MVDMEPKRILSMCLFSSQLSLCFSNPFSLSVISLYALSQPGSHVSSMSLLPRETDRQCVCEHYCTVNKTPVFSRKQVRARRVLPGVSEMIFSRMH